jgi:hypothetical protein
MVTHKQNSYHTATKVKTESKCGENFPEKQFPQNLASFSEKREYCDRIFSFKSNFSHFGEISPRKCCSRISPLLFFLFFQMARKYFDFFYPPSSLESQLCLKWAS